MDFTETLSISAPEERRKEKMNWKFEDPTDEKDELEAKKKKQSESERGFISYACTVMFLFY